MQDMKTANTVQLPEELVSQLRDFERKLKRAETVVTVLGAVCGVLITYCLLLLSDRFWDTPAWLRIPLTLLGAAGMAAFAFYWMNHWLLHRRNSRQLARLIQRRYKGLGDRLLGAVELTTADKLPPHVSPALCKAAIEQVTGECATYDFKEAVEKKRPRAYEAVFGVLVVMIITAFVLAPGAGINAWHRWANPLSDVERYTFVQIEDLPGSLVVPHGEEFEIACMLTDQSRWKPTKAVCRFEDQPEIASTISKGVAFFRIPGQTHEGDLRMRIGDVTRKIRILPTLRPELTGMTANISLPDYLQHPPLSLDVTGGGLDVLSRSTASFVGSVSRVLETATTRGATRGTIEVDANRFRTPATEITEPGTIAFEWTDSLGLACVSPFSVDITTVDDQPALVECRGINRAIAILEEEVVDMEVFAEDDFGLKSMWVNWSSSGNSERGLEEVRGSRILKDGSPTTNELAGKFSFSPIAFHIPEETMVSITAQASDYFPGRKPASSLLYRVYVLSRAEHAELVRKRMDALQARVEDLKRREEELLDANREISEMSPEKLAGRKASAELGRSEQSERTHAEELKDIAEEGGDLVEEALRNSEIPESTLGEWSQSMQTIQGLADAQMQEAASSLSQAQSQQSPSERSESLDTAMELEREVLEALESLEEQMNQSIEDMVAQSFVNRLLHCARTEGDIGSALKVMLPQTIGKSADDLAQGDRESIDAMSRRQKDIGKQTRYIQDDLLGFFNRTRVPVYEEVAKLMLGTNVVEHMEALAGTIQENLVIQSMKNTALWKEKLTEWADMLKDAAESGQGQGGEGQQEMLSQTDLEILLALFRARQREESLREQTRVLEETRRNNKRYRGAARKLADTQHELADTIRPLERKAENELLVKLLETIGGEMMNAGMFLQRPQTDSETVAIETEIIELLSESIQEASQGQGGAAAAAMLGMMPGMSGGGSNAGGAANGVSDVDGDNAGRTGNERDVEKSGGLDGTEIPEEFRNVLEAYFRAVEEKP